MSVVISTRSSREGRVISVRKAASTSIAVKKPSNLRVIAAGLRGAIGPPGLDAPGADGSPIISADPDNRIKRGADGGLHVLDDLTPDPLAYYILARS